MTPCAIHTAGGGREGGERLSTRNRVARQPSGATQTRHGASRRTRRAAARNRSPRRRPRSGPNTSRPASRSTTICSSARTGWRVVTRRSSVLIPSDAARDAVARTSSSASSCGRVTPTARQRHGRRIGRQMQHVRDDQGHAGLERAGDRHLLRGGVDLDRQRAQDDGARAPLTAPAARGAVAISDVGHAVLPAADHTLAPSSGRVGEKAQLRLTALRGTWYNRAGPGWANLFTVFPLAGRGGRRRRSSGYSPGRGETAPQGHDVVGRLRGRAREPGVPHRGARRLDRRSRHDRRLPALDDLDLPGRAAEQHPRGARVHVPEQVRRRRAVRARGLAEVPDPDRPAGDVRLLDRLVGRPVRQRPRRRRPAAVRVLLVVTTGRTPARASRSPSRSSSARSSS